MATPAPPAVLLTGAGFTHNLGGFLANDMWAEIFNHHAVQIYPSVKKEMRRDESRFNFEEVYDRVLYEENFSQAEKMSLIAAVKSVYADLDKIIQQFSQTPQSVSLNALTHFIERFAGSTKGPGYFFTLNQDLLAERRLPFEKIVELPGLPKGDRFNTRFNTSPIQDILIQLPDEESVHQSKAKFNNSPGGLVYVKLHGSMEWLASDGSYRPVIGTQKTRMILGEPLFRWYLELFQTALTAQPNKKLVVIGYGFKDLHINALIGEACARNGLRVYVVDVTDPQDFHNRLRQRGEGQQILDGLAGYYRRTLVDLFSAEAEMGPGGIALKNLTHAIFDS